LTKFNKKTKGKEKKRLEREREEFNPSSRFPFKKGTESSSLIEEIEKIKEVENTLKKVLTSLANQDTERYKKIIEKEEEDEEE